MPELDEELLLEVELLEDELLLVDELLLDEELLDDDPVPPPLPPQPTMVRELNASAIPAKRVRDLLLVILCFPRDPKRAKALVRRLAIDDVNETTPTISYYDIPLCHRRDAFLDRAHRLEFLSWGSG